MTRNHAGLSPASIEAIAGLSAGSIATLAVHPLDIVKTRMQGNYILALLKYPMTASEG